MIELLKIYRKLCDIHFGKLMELYAEGNADNALAFYPTDERPVGIMKAEQDFYQYLRESFFSNEGAFYAVWEEGTVYVSALRMEPYQDGLLLEALETHPNYRRKGYAAKLMLGVLEHLKTHSVKTIYSHIHKGNLGSINAHLACGFKRISEHAAYIDGSVTWSACTMSYSFEYPNA